MAFSFRELRRDLGLLTIRNDSRIRPPISRRGQKAKCIPLKKGVGDMRQPILLAILLAISIITTGCGKEPPTQVEAPEVQLAVAGASSEEAELTDLTRSVALTLGQDDRIRSTLHSAMTASPVAEGKLDFGAVMADEAFGFLSAMADATGKAPEALRQEQQSVRALEVYLPVPGHREVWKGGSDLVVASALDEDGLLAAFDLKGNPIKLRDDVPPDQPVLVLVPSETDFARAQASSVPQSAVAESGWDAPLLSTTSGSLIMTKTYLSDLHEPWYRGNPEIELHDFNASSGNFFKCVDNSDGYDQNNSYWYGSESILSYSQLNGTIVQFWEDDDGNPCPEPPNPDASTQVALSTLHTWALFTGISFYTGTFGWGTQVILGLWLTYNWGAAGFPNSDDFVGALMIPQDDECFATGTGDVRFYLVDESGNNLPDYLEVTEVDLDRNTCPVDVDITGDTFACPEGEPIGELGALVVGGSGTIQYEWWEDGVLRGTNATYSLFDLSVGTRRIDLIVTRDSGIGGDVRFVEVIEDPEGIICEF